MNNSHNFLEREHQPYYAHLEHLVEHVDGQRRPPEHRRAEHHDTQRAHDRRDESRIRNAGKTSITAT